MKMITKKMTPPAMAPPRVEISTIGREFGKESDDHAV